MSDEQTTQQMPNSKGKGRALQQDDVASASDQPRSGLLARIADSTTELVRDSISAANVHASNTISSNPLLGGKVSASTAVNRGDGAGSASTSASEIRAKPATSEAFRSATGEALRSVDQEHNNGKEFERFEAGSGFQSSLNQSQLQHHDHDWSSEWDTGNFEGVQHRTGGVYDDGAEVRELLSDPNFNAGFQTFVANPEEVEEQSIDDLFPQNFSIEEEQIVSKIRADLPTAPSHRPMPASHPLSLRPLSDQEQETLIARLEQFNRSTEGSEQSRLHSEGEADKWLADWEGVLNSYTDEVWGDVLPEVKKSRHDAEKFKESPSSLDTKAVARLKMILGHLRTHDGASLP